MMATKDQERAALAQMKEIVIALGEGSYIGTAFKGVWQLAEENITNDFALSAKERWETAEREEEKAKTELASLKESDAQKTEIIRQLNTELGAEQMENCEQRKEIDTLRGDNAGLLGEIASLEMDIMELKAKLYDYMTKEAGK